MQGHRRRQHDAERDQVRVDHADVGVDLDAPQVRARLLGRLAQRLVATGCALLLDLLRRLPEEEVRADGRAEHRDEHGGVFAAARKARQQRPGEHLLQRDVHHQHRADIGQQRERQPLEERRIARKGDEDLQAEGDEREQHDVDLARAAGDQLERVAHGAKIGGDVERVGGGEQADDEVEQRPREVLADVGGEPVPGDPADTRADDLNADHQRRGEEHRPQQAVAVLRAGLRIGGDAARIVVRRAGDEPRPEALDQRNMLLRAFVEQLQSIRAPERLTTSAHFAESRRMSAA